MTVRAVIAGAVTYNFTCLEDAGKVFVTYADRRVGFVILQHNVVTRTVFLD